ncbi:type II toxin-antitoxin system VapC family toxin [Oleiharenicola lentus]|jgi:toxin-antitoxin system PIN domain toxin|uniref:Ribonuclease VapC n=1 Tax=Oleiharenicola lentus TaxID=2508720 RepID=A0A4Q1C9Z0_9BACT|nr:type II toxin-antitoxin system VapC family toxin [Oleiharenicola lentus]RXK55700.1 type II toxin-antitoxin system VapC family toxin [Oleiharenicola lentus]
MILPDANLLLYAYDSDSPFHKAAAKWWTGLLSGHAPVGLCPVVIFSFLRLATHARVYERPLTVAEATARISSWIERPNVRVLYPGPKHLDVVCSLLTAAGTAGNLVSDAQIAALALEYGAEVHSADTDFARFKGLKWTNPLSHEE